MKDQVIKNPLSRKIIACIAAIALSFSMIPITSFAFANDELNADNPTEEVTTLGTASVEDETLVGDTSETGDNESTPADENEVGETDTTADNSDEDSVEGNDTQIVAMSDETSDEVDVKHDPNCTFNEGGECTCVAQVGDQMYVSLQEAINNAESNVTLLKDVSLAGTTLPKGYSKTYVGLLIEKNLEIDLAGKNLNITSGNYALWLTPGSSLTLKGTGTVSGGSSATINVKGATLTVQENAKVKSSEYSSAVAVVATSGQKAIVNIYGTIEAYFYGIGGNASASNVGNCEINVYTGASITSEGNAALYLPNPNDTTNIKGGTIEGVTGVAVRGGTLNVEGGTIVGNGYYGGVYHGFAYEKSDKRVGDGNCVYGPGIAVIRHSTNKPINVNVSNGTVKGYYALCQHNVEGKDWSGAVNLNISGGEFTSTAKAYTSDNGNPDFPRGVPYEVDFTLATAVRVADLNGFVSGGTFNTDLPNEYYVNGYGQNEDGTVVDMRIAKVGEKYFTSLAEAIQQAKVGDTVTLLNNVELDEAIEASQKNIKLDIGDYNISGSNGCFQFKSSTIEITGVKGVISSEAGTAVSIIGGDGLTVSGGTVESQNGTAISVRSTTLTVNRGDIIGKTGIYFDKPIGVSESKVVVSGGTITAEKAFEANKSATFDETNMSISDGVINGAIIFGDRDLKFISGGKFNTELPVEYLAEGYAQNKKTGEVMNAVAQIEDGAQYATLQDAIDEAGNNAVISLIKTVNEDVVIDEKIGLVLNLNDKEINSLVVNGNGVNPFNSPKKGVIVTINGGKINSVNITNDGKIITYNSEVATITSDKGRAEINGGTYGDIVMGNGNKYETHLLINSGTFTGIIKGSTKASTPVKIRGGIFANDPAGKYVDADYICHAIEDNLFSVHESAWNEEVTTEPSCTEKGVKTFTCSFEDCKATKTEEIDPTGHENATKWSTDEKNHWHACSKCGAVDEETVAAHAWDEGVVYPEATCTDEGQKTYTCTECGITKPEVIPATNHDFAGEWKFDENNHWHACSKCDDVDEGAAHVWNEEVTTEPSCTVAGEKTFTCVCGATRTEAIAANGHDFANEWSVNDDSHWIACRTCGAYGQEAAHAWNDGEVTIEPAIGIEGVRTYTCADCGATSTEAIAALVEPVIDTPAGPGFAATTPAANVATATQPTGGATTADNETTITDDENPLAQGTDEANETTIEDDENALASGQSNATEEAAGFDWTMVFAAAAAVAALALIVFFVARRRKEEEETANY